MDAQMENELQAGKKALIAENRRYWKDHQREEPCTDQWLYIYHGLSLNFEYAVHEDIIALGVQEKERLPIAVVTYGHGDELLDDLDASFGLKEVQHLFYSKFKDEESEQKTLATAKCLAASTYGKKDEFLQLTYRGIKCGDAIYDEILKKHAGEAFDCFDISEEQFCKHIKNALSVIDKAFEILQDKPPAYIVTSEPINLKGLFVSVACSMGAEVLIVSNGFPDIIMRVLPGRIPVLEHMPSICLRRQVEEYLKRETLNPVKYSDLFVYGGKQLEKQALLRHMGIVNGKKNVFVLPHVLNDTPRGIHHYCYYDYNEWFLETLRIASETPDVNWIVKDHPTAAVGKQQDYIRRMFDKYKTENMFWCSRDIGGIWIKEVADCVVTCVGEAAMEYWAYGIPTITAADAYFSAWGISYTMKSVKQYEETLRNVKSLKKPAEESVQYARKCLLALKQIADSSTQDELTRVFLDARNVQMEGYKTGERDLQIPMFCEKYIEFLKGNSIECSAMYRLQNVYDV